MRTLPTLLVVLFPLATCLAEPPTARNVVLLLADDLGYGDLACYGSARCVTPHLDRLAKEGIRMTQFNCPAPFCAPTRASLLTGRYPFRCGLMDNPVPDAGTAGDQRHLPAGEVLLPQLLGRVNLMLGKWHLGHKKDWLPTRRGFQEYFGILYSNDMRPVRLVEGDQTVEYPVVQATLTERYTRRAVEFIEQNSATPFFLYLAYAAPHKPLACSERYFRRGPHGLYEQVIAELDASVGSILDKLDELKIANQTLVIFTSDNGPWYGGSTGGLRGMKSTSYEGGYRVPMIARWPERLAAGQTIDALGTTPDLFSTIVDAVGADLPGGRTYDGKSLLPLWTGHAAASPHDYVVGQAGGQLATIRNQRWKLHVRAPGLASHAKQTDRPWTDPRAPDGVTILAPHQQYSPDDFPGVRTGDPPREMQLFDLQHDSAEQRDVAADKPDVVTELRQAFQAYAADVNGN